MKKIYLIIIIIAVLFNSACRKEGAKPHYGTITALNYDGKSVLRPNMSISILGYDGTSRCNISQYSIAIKMSTGVIEEKISMIDLPMAKTGIIKIETDKSINNCDTIPRASYGISEGGDLSLVTYSPLRNFDNYVNIQSFDSKTRVAKGNFKLTMVNNTYSAYPKQLGYRDTIVFECKEFAVPCVN